MPGVRMTANLYVPDAPGRHPAVLAVHGHWRGAKQDPVVQSRCIGAALQYIANIHISSAEPHRLNDLGEELSRSSDKGLTLDVLFSSRGFTDEQDR